MENFHFRASHTHITLGHSIPPDGNLGPQNGIENAKLRLSAGVVSNL